MKADVELFWKLLEPEYTKAMLYCRKLMANRDKGDDLFQDALVTGIRKFHDLRNLDAFRPWLYQIIISRFKSVIRLSKKRSWLSFSSQSEEILPSENPTNTHIAKIWLEKLFKILSPDEQSLIILYEMEQWTISELAKLHNKSEGAIKLKLFRIRNKLRRELKRLSNTSETTFEQLYNLVNAYVV